MRMIGIGLMGFLLAGVALLLSTMNILERGTAYVRDLTTGPHMVFEHRMAAPAQDTHTATVLRANPDHPVILSGLPAYQSVAFAMPVDARPTSGYLQIDATSQVLDGVEGVLRISIQNTRRGEMLLRSGAAGRSLQIPLSPTDFAGNQLVVSFSLQGTGPQHQCTQDGGISAVVEIETTSAVFLTLDRPLSSARDRVHAWGNAARIAWPAWLKQEEQLRRLVLATQFKRRGLATVFDPAPEAGGLTTVDLRAALPAFPEPAPPAATTGQLAQMGANAGLRRFHRQSIWRARYDLGGHAARHVPAQLDLHMQLGRLLGNQHWALTVTLNNRLVFQGHITGAQAEYQALIDLPAALHSAANTLEVVATTTAQQTGPCNQGPELVAEMQPQSRLIAGNTMFADALTELRDALGTLRTVHVGANGPMSAHDAERITALLDQLIPEQSAFKPAGRAAHITAITQEHSAPASGPAWLVTQDAITQLLDIRPLAPGQVLQGTGPALLVTPMATTTPGVAG